MDCIDLFKKAAAAMQTDPRYLEPVSYTHLTLPTT